MATEPGAGGGPAPFELVPLDPGLLQVIRPSADRMAAAEEAFVQSLHEDISALVRDLPDQGWGFCEHMVRAMLWVIRAGQPPEVVAEGLYWLGTANQANGFPASEYVSVGHALVRVVRDLSAETWTTTTGSAWIRFFMWMRPYLEAAAHQAAAQEEAVRQQEAARRQAARRQVFDQVARHDDGSADVDVSVVSDMLDDEDDDEPGPGPGYGQIMMGMTPRRRRRG